MTAAAPSHERSGPGAAVPEVAAGGSVGGLGLRGVVLAVVLGGLALGSAAMAVSSVAAFERTLMTTVDSRLSEVATAVARHVENGLQAGVALEQQRRLLAVMADERSQSPDLSTIRVVDERGRVLFSTNEAEIGEPVAPADAPVHSLTRLVEGEPVQAAWRRVGEAEITFGLPLIGLFGETLGSVTVALPKAEVEDQRERFALSLALAATAITAAGGLLAGLLLALLPLPATTRLHRLRRRLDALYLAASQAQPWPPRPAAEAEPPALAEALDPFENWLTPRLARLAEREAEVRRLDETA